MDSRYDLLDSWSLEVMAGNAFPTNDLGMLNFTTACRRAGFTASEIAGRVTKRLGKTASRELWSKINWWFDREPDRP